MRRWEDNDYIEPASGTNEQNGTKIKVGKKTRQYWYKRKGRYG